MFFTDEIQTLKGSEIKKYHSVDRINKSKNFHYSKHFLAITNIISKSYKIIINSGNIGFFIVLFRKNNKKCNTIRRKIKYVFLINLYFQYVNYLIFLYYLM